MRDYILSSLHEVKKTMAMHSKYVVIDLEFDDLLKAKATQKALRNMMTRVIVSLIFGPSLTILNVVESKTY